MKSFIAFIITLATCFSPVFAETTVEMIQQRAEAGDAQAQTLMGMMYFYGYIVPRDANIAQDWYQRAADQGDSFATRRINLAKSKTELSRTVSSNNPPASVSSSKLLTSLPKDALEKKGADASSAEYKGTATLDDLLLKRTEYIGKVVKLKINISSISTTFDTPYVRVHDDQQRSVAVYEWLMLYSQKALEWAVENTKKGHGSYSEVYVLVEENGLIALGEHRSKADGVCTYSW